jgi:hypothetical protein
VHQCGDYQASAAQNPKIRFVALVGWAITHSATELGKLLFR